MASTVKKLEKSTVELRLTVPADQFNAAMNTAYQKQRRYFNVQGFRKGKAPRRVIENFYGPDVFVEGAVDEVAPKFLEEALKEHDLELVGRPAVSLEEAYKPGQDVPLVFIVAVYPEVELGEYKGLELEKIDDTVTDEQVQAAARQAEIHDRVMELPQGYDTVLGSEGSDLSGGEAQRVAIARAIVQDAPILVLDEATAHADPENETAIQKALNALAKGRTTVVIAHRLDTIVHADQILVLVGGKVVERGVHEELLAADGHYAALWRSQQVDALEKALLVEGAAMRGAAAGPQEADGEAEPNGADSRESEER